MRRSSVDKNIAAKIEKARQRNEGRKRFLSNGRRKRCEKCGEKFKGAKGQKLCPAHANEEKTNAMNRRIAEKLAQKSSAPKRKRGQHREVNYTGRPTVAELNDYYEREADPFYYSRRDVKSVSPIACFVDYWDEPLSASILESQRRHVKRAA